MGRNAYALHRLAENTRCIDTPHRIRNADYTRVGTERLTPDTNRAPLIADTEYACSLGACRVDRPGCGYRESDGNVPKTNPAFAHRHPRPRLYQ